MCLLHQNTDSAEELIPPCTLHFVNDMELHVAAFNTTDQRVTYLKKFATYHTWVSVNPQDSNYSCSDPVIGDNPLPTNKLLLIFPLPLYCFFFFGKLPNCRIQTFKMYSLQRWCCTNQYRLFVICVSWFRITCQCYQESVNQSRCFNVF